ncbi:ethanolamine ammonia-lyase subunit EutC [Massilia litorea]|uniref:Ethanolamine ammonia-lyase small subunit n=1 Tax=Massilia litorea TaxID=2769491 RepID=A0A7L9U0H9_9BURK|nr:ethanolamine ammonia-lyase subunit EutC [Massilia litorea]QOL48541.1 ethanolamine ammonia-lyase subunit EutC [Massilia litorea]
MADSITPSDPWQALRRFTAARIALGHTGISQPTSAQLDFQLAHARARDAVHQALDAASLAPSLAAAWPGSPPLLLHSAAENRNVYLQRPDLGRRLDAPSRALLAAPHGGEGRHDLAIVVADGLSALAVARNAPPFLQALHARLAAEAWTPAPLSIVEQGRVAVGDEVGELLGAQLVVVLIGERPGLSSPDSMGLYLTWAPRVGLTDERRNCISNVRPAGLGVEEAADKLHYLLAQARARRLSGVGLKDETDEAATLAQGGTGAFLL